VVTSSSTRGKLLISWHLFHLAFAQCGWTGRDVMLGQWPKGVVSWPVNNLLQILSTKLAVRYVGRTVRVLRHFDHTDSGWIMVVLYEIRWICGYILMSCNSRNGKPIHRSGAGWYQNTFNTYPTHSVRQSAAWFQRNIKIYAAHEEKYEKQIYKCFGGVLVPGHEKLDKHESTVADS